MAFFNTKDIGPVVIEVPPGDANGSLNGNIVTQWQTSLEDVGLLGLDKGAGGKFLIVPPGYRDKVPDGYTALQSDTYGGYALIRSNLKSHGDADVANSIAYAKRVKLYPLSAAANPPETVFTDVKDVDFDSTIRYDASFFKSLDRVVQSEPWIERDRAMIDQLRTIGIEQGKPFAPDEATQKILAAAISEARVLLERRYDAGFPPFWDNSRWTMPALPEVIEGQATTYAKRDHYATDARGVGYTYAYISIKRLGAGQFYLISIRDKDGQPYDGGRTYRLTVPPSADRAVLVGDGLRPADACPDQEHVAREPRLERSRVAQERRRSCRHLLRSQGAGRPGRQLGADRSAAWLRADVPPLCAEEGILRQGLEAARRREGRAQ
jgi:hypothetical protein